MGYPESLFFEPYLSARKNRAGDGFNDERDVLRYEFVLNGSMVAQCVLRVSRETWLKSMPSRRLNAPDNRGSLSQCLNVCWGC